MGGKTSDYAYQTGRGMARNIKPTPEGLAALDRWEAQMRAALLAKVRAELIGRIVK